MAEYINIASREMPERERTWHWEPGEDYSESTGNREIIKYSGRWEALLTLAAASGSANSTYDTTATVTRQSGDMAELQITKELYRRPDDDEEDDEQTTDELGSEENPTYTSVTSKESEPLLAAQEYQGLADLELRALKAMMDGQDANSYIDNDASSLGRSKIKDCITSTEGQKAFGYFKRGIFYKLVPSTTVNCRWTGGGNSHSFGEIVTTTPGGFHAPANHNFMCVGTSKEKSGKKTVHTATFLLSGFGGWEASLYGSGSSS